MKISTPSTFYLSHKLSANNLEKEYYSRFALKWGKGVFLLRERYTLLAYLYEKINTIERPTSL